MSVSKRILAYLDKNKIKYRIVPHKTVYTAFDLAATLKEKLQKITKTLLVKVDKKYVLVVIPAHYRLDLKKVAKFVKAKKAEIAKEPVIKKILKLKPGVQTPFGSLHKLEVLLDKGLARAKEVLVGAGTYTEHLRLKVKDLHRVEKARLADIVEKGKGKKK